jgi:DNA polymerase-1
MPAPKLAIIDAYSLLYRAFFALPPLTNKQGEVTNAAYGFTMMLIKLLDEQQPDYLAVAFDLPTATFRHEAYDGYKAHRKPMPDAMRPQVPMTREILEAMHVPMLSAAGYEADDVIGTLARRAEEVGIDTLIVTADRDAFQLVDDHVHVLVNKKGVTDTQEYDPAAVVERYGVTPAQIPDIKALTGDASDNIPGVPGIGEKTAGKLIAHYGSLETLLAHADEVGGKTGASLAAYTEQAIQSKALATIHTAAPLEPFTWDALRVHPWDQPALLELFRRFDFRSLLGRLTAPAEAPTPADDTPLGAVRVVDTPEALARLARDIAEVGRVALAPVGAGPDPLHHALVGLGLSAGDLHVYIPLQGAPPQQATLFGDETPAAHPERLQPLAGVLADPAVKKSGYDLKHAWLWLHRLGLALEGLNFDALLAAYCLDPTARHTPADIAFDTLRQHRELPDPSALWRAGDAGLPTAAGELAQLVRRLETPLRTAMAEADVLPLFRDIEMPLIPVLARMEARGIALDTAHLAALSEDLGKRIYDVERDIYALAGESFTINSPKQLQTILFDKLGLPKGRKTKTGYSTDADTLAGLAERHEIVRHILTYRELTKLKSTYVDSLPQLVDPADGRVHTHFSQAVTATGRLSSHDPNLQNIPIRTPEGREIRKAFVPAPGWRLLAADYSQIELRVLAHITGDEALIEVFKRGEDLHTATACRVFGVEPAAVTREMRRMAKIVNFSIPYGTTAFGLAGQLGSTRELADELMTTYLTRFPGVAAYMERVVSEARRDGVVTTLLGRRRPLPDLQAPVPTVRQAAERTAINTPIQGSAADIMKLAMLHLDAALRARDDLHGRLLLQVHDEMVLETPADEVEATAALLIAAMRDAYPLVVPLDVEVKTGPNWRDVTPPVEDVPVPPAE